MRTSHKILTAMASYLQQTWAARVLETIGTQLPHLELSVASVARKVCKSLRTKAAPSNRFSSCMVVSEETNKISCSSKIRL